MTGLEDLLIGGGTAGASWWVFKFLYQVANSKILKNGNNPGNGAREVDKIRHLEVITELKEIKSELAKYGEWRTMVGQSLTVGIGNVQRGVDKIEEAIQTLRRKE